MSTRKRKADDYGFTDHAWERFIKNHIYGDKTLTAKQAGRRRNTRVISRYNTIIFHKEPTIPF